MKDTLCEHIQVRCPGMLTVTVACVFLIAVGRANAYVCYEHDSSGPSLAWFARAMQIDIADANGQDLSFTDLRDTTGAAIEAWNDIGCSDFSFSINPTGATTDRTVGFNWFALPESNDNHNIVVFRSIDDDPENDWLNPPEQIALATVTWVEASGALLDADIELNDVNYDFADCVNTSCSGSQVDLQNTLAHELGHVLGLDHPPDPEATMYGGSAANETKKRTLETDDIDGVCFLYPLGGGRGECFGVERIEPADILIQERGGCDCMQSRFVLSCFTLLALLRFRGPRKDSL